VFTFHFYERKTVVKIKVVIIAVFFLFIALAVVNGKTGSNEVVDSILSTYSARVFSEKPVGDNEIEQILKCGIKAPSARNSQLWKFTVVKDISLVQDIFRSINKGNVVIIVSGLETKEEGIDIDFDSALAVQNMYIAAQSFGLGAHIYTGPILKISSELKNELKISDEYRIIALLRIGNPDNGTDAISSASPRKEMDDVVNIIK
jgi:nitroreductase